MEYIEVTGLDGLIAKFSAESHKKAKQYAESLLKQELKAQGKREYRIAWTNEEECFAVNLMCDEILTNTVMMDYVMES